MLLTNWPILPAAVSLAQADQLSGGAGWVGAGLLGAVLAWLMFKHLPEKDRQINDFIKAKDEQLNDFVKVKDERIATQRQEFTATLTALAATFRQEASAERQSCEKHYATLAATMDAAFKTLGEQLRSTGDQQRLHSERNQQWIELLKGEIEKEKQKLAAAAQKEATP